MGDKTDFGVEVRFLNRSYAATAHNDWRAPEWPPHPARLFSAMVHEWASAGEDAGERAALEWMESLDPPDMYDPGALIRDDRSVFVPNHDEGVLDKWSATSKSRDYPKLLGGALDLAARGPAAARPKSERQMPAAAPGEETAAFIWRTKADAETLKRLDSLLSRVTRLGHSSMVACRVVNADDYAPNLLWNEEKGDAQLRWVVAGQLGELERVHKTHGGTSRTRILPYRNASYARAGADKGDKPSSEFQPNRWLVFEFAKESRVFGDGETAAVAAAMRRAFMRYAKDPMPPELSGHDAQGDPLRREHVGFHPIPYVDNPYADGRLMGIAVSVPPEIDAAAQRSAYLAIGNWLRAADGGCLTLTIGKGAPPIQMRYVELGKRTDLRTLWQSVWANPSERWATATPIAMLTDCHKVNGGSKRRRASGRQRKRNGGIREARAARSIGKACAMSGYPEPKSVKVDFVPFIAGASHAKDYPPFIHGGRRRMLLHALVEFDEKVAGPMALGAGRYVGMGLMKPLEGRGDG